VNVETTELVHRLLSAQHGVAGFDQLTRCGLTQRQIYALRESTRLRLTGPQTFAAWGAPQGFERDIVSGLLVLGDGAVVSHRAAARLWGFDGFEDATAEFTTTRMDRNSGVGLVVHSTRRLAAGDIASIFGHGLPPSAWTDRQLLAAGLITSWPISTAARTIIDLCSVTDVDGVAAAVDSACRLGLVSPSYLARFAQPLRSGRPWIAILDAVLLDAGVHSWLEREFSKLVRRHGLPKPRTQVVHRTADIHARVDFEFTEQRVIVEVSGRRGHSSDADRERDAQRRNQLQSEGFAVVEYSTHAVMHRGDKVAAEIAAWLRQSPRGHLNSPIAESA